MSFRSTIATLAAFALAAAGSAAAAWVGATVVEGISRDAVLARLHEADLDWAQVRTDGLQLVLSGTAPDEPARFRAITRAGGVVDPERVIDAMEVAARDAVTAPRFSLEILRNEDEVSVIGLVPTEGGVETLNRMLSRAGGSARLEVTNMVETADYPVPATWETTLRFALSTLDDLPRSKVSVAPGRVTVTAVADSDEAKTQIERKLNDAKPADVALVLDIAAPRPVISPFTLRFVIPPEGAPRFEACAVDGEAERMRIVAAAQAAGMTGPARCVIGLGVPSASWSRAAETGIASLARLGGGALTMSDADVSLVARESADPALFETVVAELETDLPDLFVLSAVLPEPKVIDGTGDAETGTPEFVASLSPEGKAQLRGRLYDAAQEAAVASYGRALFGSTQTYVATREDATLPQGWPVRVLAAMDALSMLENGSVVVQPDLVAIRGVTGSTDAEARISGLLSDKLGVQADFRIDVTYDAELDPLLNIPTPEECETQLNAILGEQKLSFAPGEAVIEPTADGPLAQLETKLDLCNRAVFEIGGHTDSQGSEGGNQSLSLERAEAVRAALVARGTAPSQLVAEGYGEVQPISDNGTEAGREANRRITFTLLGRREGAVDAATVAGQDASPEAEAPDAPVAGEPEIVPDDAGSGEDLGSGDEAGPDLGSGDDGGSGDDEGGVPPNGGGQEVTE